MSQKPTISNAQLTRTFDTMKLAIWNNIPGVICIDSGQPGPTLGITACTHGNEPSGIAVIQHLLDVFNIRERLKIGKLFLVVNNIKAFERYLLATSTSDEEKARSRFNDLNMNRLPKDLRTRINDVRYEITRAKELLPVWSAFDVGFDIHSTSQESEPMIITGNGKVEWSLVYGFPIDTIISNIDAIQVGAPAFGFFGEDGKGIPVFEIESGSHENPRSYEIACACAVALLQNLCMVDGQAKAVFETYKEYEVGDSVMFPDESYEVVATFPHFRPELKQGTVLAASSKRDAPEIIMPFDGSTVFCPKLGVRKSIAEEIMFLCRPVQIIQSRR